MRGFKLDLETHDLSLDAAGRLETVDGPDATAQEIKTRLLFFKGECAKDLREGVPWYQEILEKGTDTARVQAIIRQVILSVPAVLDVTDVTIDHDPATRHSSISWEARDRTGARVSSEAYGPLVLP